MRKLIEKEQLLRDKDQLLFTHVRDSDNLRSDLRNMTDIAENLRKEIEFVNIRRKELEQVNSELKTQLCDNSIVIRQISSEMDGRQRDILALSKNIEIFKRNEDNLRLENLQLRELVMNIEQQRVDLQA